MRPTAPLFVLALTACAPEPFTTDDTDTDASESDDTEPPPDLDASGWEIDPTATQRFSATLIAENARGETQERDVNFAMDPAEITHAVVPFEGTDYRNIVGSVQANVPVGNTQVLTRFEMRLVIPEDIQEKGTFDCRGDDRYGVTLAIAAVGASGGAGALSFSSTRLDPADASRPCSITIARNTFQRVTAELDVAWMLSNAKNDEGENLAGRIEDMVVDVILREAAPSAE